jgi:hypothetical protein
MYEIFCGWREYYTYFKMHNRYNEILHMTGTGYYCYHAYPLACLFTVAMNGEKPLLKPCPIYIL